jgi:protein-arginine kinase activator protein McsA
MKQQRKQRRGAAAIEFALTLPLMMSILLGIIEFGFYLNNKQVYQNIVAETCGVDYYDQVQEVLISYYGGCSTCYAQLTEDPFRYICDMEKPYNQITGFFPASMMPTSFNLRAIKRKTEEQIEAESEYYY